MPRTCTRTGWGSTRRRGSPPSSAGRSRCSTTPTRPGWPRWRSAPAATCRGVVLLLTFGTGIGSALFLDGRLVPNTELGHLELHGADAELHASDRIRDEQGLSWPDWATRVQDYIAHVERLLSPDLIVLGGGVSKKADRFLPYVKVGTPVVPAVLQNNAGIVGAAMATTGRF